MEEDPLNNNHAKLIEDSRHNEILISDKNEQPPFQDEIQE